ncbi:MAG: ssDNA-binding protein [Bacillota bacterium]
MSNQNPQRVVTGKVRLSYCHLFTPYANPNGNGEPKYSVTILLPKSDVATKQRIDVAIQAAVSAGISSRWNGVRPPQIAIPIHDGDGVRPSDGMPFGDEYKGHWVFTASSKQPPQIVDLSLNPIINQSEVYSGIYARVSVQFFPYSNSGKKGIGCSLGNVQKLEDGEPLGGRTTAADDFGGYAPAAPTYRAPAYQQPAYPQQPSRPASQPGYPGHPVQIDPITGRPLIGNVMGL